MVRCRAERKVTRERAAILRAYLKRNQKLEVTVGLNKESPSVGYRLGRLMAVLERVQGAAQNNPNKTIVDRYYGAASTRPATVFPRLDRNVAAPHGEAESWIAILFTNPSSREVLDGIASFPSVLTMEEQGLFALGYYHQRRFSSKSPTANLMKLTARIKKGKQHEFRKANRYGFVL